MQKLRINNESKIELQKAFIEFIQQKEYEALAVRSIEKYTTCWHEFKVSLTALNTS